MVKCPNCNNEVKIGNFCGKCGTKINDEVKTSDTRVCPKCNENTEKDSIFCPNCGFNFLDSNNSKNDNKKEGPTKFCPNCGEKIDINAVICPKCGVKIASINEKNPTVALILSFFIIGLGQVYNGQIKKGILLFVAAIISGILFIIFIGIVLWLIIWVYGMYDAHNTAKEINNGFRI